MYSLILDITVQPGLMTADTVKMLTADTDVQAEYLDRTPGAQHPSVKFTGPALELVTVIQRYAGDDVAAITSLMSCIKPETALDGTRAVSDAATRLRKYVAARGQMEGIDPEVIHIANDVQLRRSDLTLVLDALGRDH